MGDRRGERVEEERERAEGEEKWKRAADRDLAADSQRRAAPSRRGVRDS